MTFPVMTRRIEFRPYRREFVRPLQTARGEWSVREGFVVRVEASGRIGYGEVAPLPEFGTETADEAQAFLEYLVEHPDAAVPLERTCCAFGLSAATAERGHLGDREVAALLPAGSEALQAARVKCGAGYRSFKWKIGFGSVEVETEICDDLLDVLGPERKLRLDGNCGLDPQRLEAWLSFLQPHAEQIEFIEQPLPVGQEQLMAELSAASAIPIALDESLNGRDGLAWFEPGEWKGPLVIKPLLMGDVHELAERLRPHAERLVFSSVFETGVGLSNAFSVMGMLPRSRYALGFDTLNAFNDSLSIDWKGPCICAAPISALDLDELWNCLPHSN